MEWRAYWKPNITINLIADFTQYVSWKSLFFGALFFMYMLWILAGHNFPSKLVTLIYVKNLIPEVKETVG